MTSTSPSVVWRFRATLAAGWLGPWLAIGALALWTSSPGGAPLVLAASGATATALWGPRGRGLSWGLGSAVLVLAILTAFLAQRQVGDLRTHWDERWDTREAQVGALLDRALQERLVAGEGAADALAQLERDGAAAPDVAPLRSLRERYGTSALALYDPAGRLVVWDGVHWGRVPEVVLRGGLRHAYQDRPLFGYLYVSAIAPDGSVAVAAELMRADLPEALDAALGDFSATFRSDVGERIRITQNDPGGSEGVWDLALPDRRLLSVVVERPDPAERVAVVMGRWRVVVASVTFLGWLLLAFGGMPRLAAAALSAAGLMLLAAWVPLQELEGLRMLFDPAYFSLPGPVPVSLGRLSVLVLTGFTFIAVLPRPAVRVPPAVAGLLVGLGFTLLLAWLRAGVGPTFLAQGRLEWVTYEVTAAGILTLLAGTLLAFTRTGKGSRILASAAIVVALLLGAAASWGVWHSATVSGWWPLAWAIPVGMAAAGAGAWHGWQRPVVGWTLAVLMAGTAALPMAWSYSVEARMGEGMERLRRLAAEDDPELSGGLLLLGAAIDSLEGAGKTDVGLLYSAWQASGLADAGHPVRLTQWRADGLRGEELRAGIDDELPDVMATVLAEGRRAGAPRLFRFDRDDARYILTAPLRDGQMISVVAPPFVERERPSSLGPFVRGVRGEDVSPLSFIPLSPGDPRSVEPTRWVRTTAGWQAEVALEFSNGPVYHAHYAVALPGPLLAAARASLLLVLELALFATFWLAGRALMREVIRPEVRLSRLVISFRARVTLALFGFFALANALFGTVAYRTLAQASHRSAQVLAERVVEDAAGWYRALGGGMERLSRQVGAELIEYRGGALREGSVEELVELGLYEGWTPYDIHVLLDGREGVLAVSETSVGHWQYVTAFRRLPDGDILAAEVPLQAGTAAIQSTDLLELLGFVVLLGAALSLALAMIAGRALTRPIRALQVASERVGSGNLALRLPAERADEFGEVFQAFNRMVGRVRKARRQLVRTSRRTQLIMDEAAVGMIAVDPIGRVTLVNPRAEELLGAGVHAGLPLTGEGPLGAELRSWLKDFLEGALDQADAELQAGERRLRVRGRRLGSYGTKRGAVVALDDVTDELRAERVLAWGEMARQVAHEVKNPLTPMKLSAQHLRRAWDDQHPDFGEVLVRNVDAMLGEIDRLAAIAQSFSRFGAPGGDERVPLAPVSVSEIVAEVMALYGATEAPVRFEHRIDPDLPPVQARDAELKEVLVNLLENARLAGKKGGLVAVRARLGAPASVVLEVEDDGAGIPGDVLPRIFEPKFSTRSKGTGLGLAIVQRLVHSWGGDIAVVSEPGRGTTASVSLRIWPKAVGRASGSPSPELAS